MENLVLDVLNLLLSRTRENFSGGKHSCKCSYCSKNDFSGYRYKCLECYEYDLCNQCFEKRKFNESHLTSHKVIRFSEPNKSICGTNLKKEDLYLDKLKETYSNARHLNVKCNICKCEPIKGLRFKCDSCVDFNVCEKCSEKSFDKHKKTHPLIAYCQTVSSEIKINEVKMGSFLGKGGFGGVCKATYKNETVACKKIPARKDTLLGITLNSDEYDILRKSYIRELEGYNEIKGENILRMIGHCSVEVSGGHDFFILSEIMKCDLEHLIKNEPNLSNRRRFDIATGIASGMARIHSMGYIHRDIRIANILVTEDYVPKIGDMGIMKLYEENARVTKGVGAKWYMPPEYYSITGAITNKLDVFTFGLTLNELFGGRHVCENKKINVVSRGKLMFPDFISKCIDNDPNNRPLSKDLEDKLSFMNALITEDLKNDVNYLRNEPSIENCNKTFESKFNTALRRYKEVTEKKDQELTKENRKKIKSFYEKLLKREELFNSSFEDSQVPFILNFLRHLEHLEDNSQKCLEYCQKYLNKAQEIFKVENHREIATSLAAFGYAYLFLIKNYKEALSYYERASNMNKALFGEDCAVVANNYFRIGECYFEMNDVQESLKYHLKSLEIRRSIHDSNSEYIIDSLNKIQTCYLKLENVDKYLRYRREEIKIKREIYRIEHPEKEYHEIFLIRGKDNGREVWHYVEIENEPKYEAIKKTKAGTNIDVTDYGKIIESGWGKDPPSYIVNQVSKIYDINYPQFENFKINGKSIDKSMYENASDDPILSSLYSGLKADYEFNNGEDNLDVINSLLSIMRYYVDEIQDSYNCIVLSDKCLEICERLFRKEANRYTAEALHLKACCYLFFDNEEKRAISYFKEVLEIRVKLFGHEHPGVSATYFKIGQCHFKLNEIKESLESFLKCLEIRKKIYSNKSNVFIVYALDEIVNCYEKLEDMDNFSKYRSESLGIKRDLFKILHPDRTYYDAMLIRGKDRGKPAWHYILIENESRYGELKKCKVGANVDVTDYGKIIESGWGSNPPKAIIEKINRAYGYELD